jgi:hypothetical protein
VAQAAHRCHTEFIALWISHHDVMLREGLQDCTGGDQGREQHHDPIVQSLVIAPSVGRHAPLRLPRSPV